MSEKVCPLLSIPGTLHPCEGDRCAWLNVDRCAVVDIARSVGELENISGAAFDFGNPQ